MLTTTIGYYVVRGVALYFAALCVLAILDIVSGGNDEKPQWYNRPDRIIPRVW